MVSPEVSVGDRVYWSSTTWVVTDVGDTVRIEHEGGSQLDHKQEAMRFDRATFEGRLVSSAFDMRRLSDDAKDRTEPRTRGLYDS